MNKLLTSLQTNDSVTTNGMPTHSTSLNKNVDFFFLAGASRNMNYREMTNLFEKAYAEDKLLALKILFWARDVRGGAGERKIFHTLVKYIADRYPAQLFDTGNYKLISEYGRWKDLFLLLEDESLAKFEPQIIALIKAGLENKETQGLLAKWLPRKGALAVKIRNGLGMSPKQYRKTIVGLSNTVESAMAVKDYSSIEYDKIPSVAFNKYRKAFERNDAERFTAFLDSVEKGETKVNAATLFPHTLYKQMRGGVSSTERRSLVEQWNALPNYMEGNDESILTVVDVSGSMTWNACDQSGTYPIHVSVALGLYFSERMEGAFKDTFVTFSSNPKLQTLSGDLFARAQQLERSEWGGSTNLEGVFNLVLNAAKRGSVPASDMPSKILILSDMEFNSAVSNASDNALQMIERKYEAAGYKMPGVIFWNLNGRIGNVPAHANQRNAALLSGFSPATVKGVLGGEVLTPIDAMMNVLNSERYASIQAV